MFTRKEVNLKQIKLLIDDGFLPVSIDYRLCPELSILDGPITTFAKHCGGLASSYLPWPQELHRVLRPTAKESLRWAGQQVDTSP